MVGVDIAWNDLLRGLRGAGGFSQVEWSALIGAAAKPGSAAAWSTDSISRWERGDRPPNAATADAITAVCTEKGLFDAIGIEERLLRTKLAQANLALRGARASQSPRAGRTEWSGPHPPPDPWERRHNLPVELTSFVGRERELTEIGRLVGTARLVTLTGVGGSGKTRLAVAMARRLVVHFPDGAYLVELAGLTDPGLVAQTIGAALGIREGTSGPLDTLSTWLKERDILVVIDNCEHLADACAHLVEILLQRSSGLRVLATSREPLRIAPETTYRLSPLAAPGLGRPESLEEIAQYPSVQLFVDRASAVGPGFVLTSQNAQTVGDLCSRLDGIPLAIELAAARVRVLALDQIKDRLGDGFHLLTGGSRTAPGRQQTLKATLDWSFDLLSPVEQLLLGRLAVFPNGFDLEAAESVAGENEIGIMVQSPAPLPARDVLDHLTALVDKSLVVGDQQAPITRYHLLEPVRQYALEHLRASKQLARIRSRHAEYCAELAAPPDQDSGGFEHQAWFDLLETNLDNLRVTLDWARCTPEQAETGLQIAGDLWRFWEVRGHVTEGRRWLAELLAIPPAAIPTAARAQALFAASWLTMLQEGDEAAESLVTESVGICRSLDDHRGLGWPLWLLGYVQRRRDPVRARILAQECLARGEADGDLSLAGWSHWLLGDLARIRGDFEEATAELETAVSVLPQPGNAYAVAVALRSLAQVAAQQSDYMRALEHMRQGLILRWSLDDRWNIPDALEGLAWVAGLQGRAEGAVRLYGAAETLRETCGLALLSERWARREHHLSRARRHRTHTVCCRLGGGTADVGCTGGRICTGRGF